MSNLLICEFSNIFGYGEVRLPYSTGVIWSHCRIDEIISSIELAQWSYFATKNRNNEKENLDKTITKGRKGIIKFCNKILVGKTNKEIGLITDLCKKYPFPVF